MNSLDVKKLVVDQIGFNAVAYNTTGFEVKDAASFLIADVAHQLIVKSYVDAWVPISGGSPATNLAAKFVKDLVGKGAPYMVIARFLTEEGKEANLLNTVYKLVGAEVANQLYDRSMSA